MSNGNHREMVVSSSSFETTIFLKYTCFLPTLIDMASVSAPNFLGSSYGAKGLCRIVGLTCLAGFVIDMVAVSIPPDPLAIQWRISFLQQLSDRSIILLFGAALMLYGSIENRRLIQQLSLACLLVGILFHISCIVVIRDSTIIRQQAIETISNQATQLQTQIEQSQGRLNGTTPVTPDQLQQASRRVTTQAQTLQDNAKTGVFKAGFASIGNLVVVGLGLLGLGRFGLRLRKG